MHVNQSCIGTLRTWSTRSDFSSSDVNCISLLKTSQPRSRLTTFWRARMFKSDSDRADPEIIWRKFEERLELQVNFRIERFYQGEYKQKNTENIQNFVAR